MRFPFDNRLAQGLRKAKLMIFAKRRKLWHKRGECACNSDGLCAHHAEIAHRLDNAMRQIDLAIERAEDRYDE